MTEQNFDVELCELLSEMQADHLIFIPGIYEILAEHYNNEVLERLEEKSKIRC